MKSIDKKFALRSAHSRSYWDVTRRTDDTRERSYDKIYKQKTYADSRLIRRAYNVFLGGRIMYFYVGDHLWR